MSTFYLHNVMCTILSSEKKMILAFVPIQDSRVCKRAEHLHAWCYILHSN